MSLTEKLLEVNAEALGNYKIDGYNKSFVNITGTAGDMEYMTINQSFGNDTPSGNVWPQEPASKEVIAFLSLLFCVIGTVGLIGNSLVIIVILCDRKMRQSVTNIFILNLATADFIIMLAGIPEIVQFMLNRGWLLGPVFCKMNRFVLVVCLYVSILSLVSVCIER